MNWRTAKRYERIMLICLVLLFLANVVIFRFQIFKDTAGYLSQDPMREPVYPTFLFILQVFNRINPLGQLYAAVVIQNLLAAFCVWFSTGLMSRVLRFKPWQEIITCGFFVLLHYIQWILEVLIVSGDIDTMFPCSILTEGITTPLFLLWFVCMYAYIADEAYQRPRWFYFVTGIAIFLSLCRGQMMLFVVITALGGLLVAFWRKESVKRPIITLVMSFVCIFLLTRVYHLCMHGKWMGNTFGPMNQGATAIYLSNEHDVYAFDDEQMQDYFIEIIHRAGDNQYSVIYADKNLLALADHAQYIHDSIKYDVMNDYLLGEIYSRNPEVDSVEAQRMRDEIVSKMNRVLLRVHFVDFVRLYIGYFLEGIVQTVAIFTPILFPYSFAVVLLAIVIATILLIRNPKDRAGLLMGFTVFSMFVNSAGVSLVIMPFYRYMFYLMPLFYFAYYAVLMEIWNGIQSKRESKS